MAARSQPPGSRWWSTGSRWRWPTTARRCSRCCATASATAPPRTAAARRASAGAARCWWTASHGSRASRPPGGSHGRTITTVDGLPAEVRDRWAGAFCATGASQCGFCTPGIVCRLEGLRAKQPAADHAAVEQALLAHLCRCTGWRTILDAWDLAEAGRADPPTATSTPPARAPPSRRAARSSSAPAVALGQGGFSDDTAPADALVAVPDGAGGWAVGATLAEARAIGRQGAGSPHHGRRHPSARAPARAPGRPRCAPAGWSPPTSSRTPRGASPAASRTRRWPTAAPSAASSTRRRRRRPRRLADEHGRPVRVLLNREDVVRLGPKRPAGRRGCRREQGRGCCASCARRASPRPSRRWRPDLGGRGGGRAGTPDLVRPAGGRLGGGDRAARRRPGLRPSP